MSHQDPHIDRPDAENEPITPRAQLAAELVGLALAAALVLTSSFANPWGWAPGI